ncbi:MAG: biotin--[acetyl-CoA-carboxylase] ligase [Candidatus Eremiobacteraeota bacterium]|nr:biotin--[acetyl-CoA-carboxylase] ligase [Candidatus Eremiobacteraeota bacterium]
MFKAGPYARVARELAETAFGSIEYLEETESTNADAAALLEQAPLRGHTIVAEYQRRGTGRKGRVWLAPAGTALLFTTILPRSIDTDRLWVVPYWSALAVRAALITWGVQVTLQWPNDLLIGEGKVAGVLCQSSVSGPSARVACGVGVNVRRPAVDPGIQPPAAYCDDVAAPERAGLLASILREFDRSLFMLDQPERVSAAWNHAAEMPGRRYRLALDGDRRNFEAIAQGLGDRGALRVLRDDGKHETIALADARVLR